MKSLAGLKSVLINVMTGKGKPDLPSAPRLGLISVMVSRLTMDRKRRKGKTVGVRLRQRTDSPLFYGDGERRRDTVRGNKKRRKNEDDIRNNSKNREIGLRLEIIIIIGKIGKILRNTERQKLQEMKER